MVVLEWSVNLPEKAYYQAISQYSVHIFSRATNYCPSQTRGSDGMIVENILLSVTTKKICLTRIPVKRDAVVTY